MDFLVSGRVILTSTYSPSRSPIRSITVAGTTDGIPEAADATGSMFGTARMLAALNKEPDLTPEQILKTVRTEVNGFVNEAEPFDDLTMLCIEYTGPTNRP